MSAHVCCSTSFYFLCDLTCRLFWTNLSDQHGKIISRAELEKIMAKEKTEELEVIKSLYEQYTIDFIYHTVQEYQKYILGICTLMFQKTIIFFLKEYFCSQYRQLFHLPTDNNIGELLGYWSILQFNLLYNWSTYMIYEVYIGHTEQFCDVWPTVARDV